MLIPLEESTTPLEASYSLTCFLCVHVCHIYIKNQFLNNDYNNKTLDANVYPQIFHYGLNLLYCTEKLKFWRYNQLIKQTLNMEL